MVPRNAEILLQISPLFYNSDSFLNNVFLASNISRMMVRGGSRNLRKGEGVTFLSSPLLLSLTFLPLLPFPSPLELVPLKPAIGFGGAL